MYCASDNHNYICQTWAKEFLNWASIKQVLGQIGVKWNQRNICTKHAKKLATSQPLQNISCWMVNKCTNTLFQHIYIYV